MKRYVLGFAFAPDGSCVLIEKTKPDWQNGLVNGLGGSVEDGESLLHAMEREFREESGLRSIYWEYALTINGQNKNKPVNDNWELNVFRGKLAYKWPVSDCDEGRVFYADSPPENMEQTARWLYWLCRDDSVFGLPMSNDS